LTDDDALPPALSGSFTFTFARPTGWESVGDPTDGVIRGTVAVGSIDPSWNSTAWQWSSVSVLMDVPNPDTARITLGSDTDFASEEVELARGYCTRPTCSRAQTQFSLALRATRLVRPPGRLYFFPPQGELENKKDNMLAEALDMSGSKQVGIEVDRHAIAPPTSDVRRPTSESHSHSALRAPRFVRSFARCRH